MTHFYCRTAGDRVVETLRPPLLFVNTSPQRQRQNRMKMAPIRQKATKNMISEKTLVWNGALTCLDGPTHSAITGDKRLVHPSPDPLAVSKR